MLNKLKSLFSSKKLVKNNIVSMKFVDGVVFTMENNNPVKTNTEDIMANPKYSNIVVLLDPGHAKSTPGKRMTKDGENFYEYEFNRELSKMISEKLEKIGIASKIIVTEVNEDIALSKRAERANKIISSEPGKKHLFISVHANACGNGSSWMSGRGFEAWTTVGKTKSDDLAECICNAAESILKPKGISVRTDKSDGDKDKEKDFTVIFKTNCPAVLTENLFYDNKEDLKFMKSNEGKELLADVHVKGITDYIDKFC